MAPGGPPAAYCLITPGPLIWTRPMVPGGHGVARGPACLTTRTSAPAGRPAEPALRGPSSGLTVIMLAASVIP